MPQVSPSRDQNKFVVRLPDGMRDRIAVEAKMSRRSMNAEIVARLEESLNRTEPEWRATPEARETLLKDMSTLAALALIHGIKGGHIEPKWVEALREALPASGSSDLSDNSAAIQNL